MVEEQLCPFGTLPTPPDLSQYAPEDGRIFDGWDSMIIAVMGEMEYHAVYLPAPTRYTVRFWSDDGRLLLEQLLLEGEMPTPPPDSELVRDDGSTFLGWDAEIVPATADAEYRTVYKLNINHGTDDDPPPDDSTGTPKTPPSLPVVLLSCAGVLLLLCKGAPSAFYAKEGLVCVGLSWIVLSLFGCLPFFFSREIPNSMEFDSFDEIVKTLRWTAAPGDLILTVGAGDVYKIGERLLGK